MLMALIFSYKYHLRYFKRFLMWGFFNNSGSCLELTCLCYITKKKKKKKNQEKEKNNYCF